MLCEHGNIAPCVECDVEPLEQDLKRARQIITDLVEHAEQNDPGNPHIGRAKGFLSGGELEEYEPSQLFSAFRMRFQAKALEERVAYIEQKARAKSLGDAAIISHLKQYATRLRQQADQLKNTHD